ncbi:hypothetical protein LDENG_00177890 [Lucifuga dentata]|nr:hypothetical protein LDENG_00177890 [Lucifuga dentata]
MKRITGKASDETLIELKSATDSQTGDDLAVLTIYRINLHSDENNGSGNGNSLSERGSLPGHTETDKLQSNNDTVFFRDGVRRIDFVLSYVDDKDGEKKQVSVNEK